MTATVTAPPAVEVRHASVTFGGVRALSDVAIAVEHGQVRGLIGPNGAGKSTLVNVLAGVYRPRAAEVRLAGHDVRSLSPEARARRGLGRTFQAPTLFSSLTLRENFRLAEHFGAARRNMLEDEQRHWLDQLVTQYEMTAWLDVVCRHIPYPVQKLADSIRALLAAPAVLVVDEPAAGLTLEDKQRVHDLLAEARDHMSMAVLVIDHDVSMMFRLSNRITVLNGGMLIAEGDPADIARDPEVIRAYLGEPV